MACHLLSKDLEDVVGFDALTLAPSEDPPQLDSPDLRKRDGKAKARIMIRLSDDILALAQNACTSHDLWKLLHETYQRSSMAAVASSLKSLINTRKLQSQTVSSYIADIQTKVLALQNTGVKLQEKLVVALILANLPEEFKDVTTAMDVLDDVSISKATSMLLNAEVSEMQRPPNASVSASHVHSLESQVEALREQVRKLSTTSRPKSTCSISWHTHPGGDDACFTKHPELRKRNSSKHDKISLYTRLEACSTSIYHEGYNETIADTGASSHMFRDASSFTTYESCPGPTVMLGDSSNTTSIGRGSAEFLMGNSTITLQDVIHVPRLSKNLFSIGQSTSTGAKFVFDGDRMLIYSRRGYQPPTGKLIAEVRQSADNLYRMSSAQRRSLENTQQQTAQFTTQMGGVDRQTWHQRLGHVNDRDLDTLIRRSAIGLKVQEQKWSLQSAFVSPASCQR
jgi:nitrate reductase NapAB chaperone NapD